MAKDYKALAEVYEDLESTTKKLKKRDIIADFIKKLPSEQLQRVVLLVMGRVFPAWSDKEIGIANKLMIKAISKATGANLKDVKKEFKKKGDLGTTAEELIKGKKQRTLSSKKNTIKHVFETIQKIAEQEGKGSQEKKLDLIAGLLSNAKPKEARYIVRTVLDELRIGVAEGIVRDAIAKAFDVKPKAVEDAYHLNPDYGEIAKTVKKKGKKGLKKVSIEPGTPIKALLAEKAPDLKTALKKYENPILEWKYDGMRALIHKKGKKIWIFTRRLENVSNAFPDLVKLSKKNIKAKDCIIDGEVLGIDGETGRPVPFQKLSTRIKRKYDIKKAAKEIPIQFNAFDILYLNGNCLFDKALKKRRKILKKKIKTKKDKFQLTKFLITKDLKKAEEFYKDALSAGQEGIIVKNLDAAYQPGRRVAGGWLKVKPVMETLDLAIIGATWGIGKRTGWLGSFKLGCREATTGKFLACGMLGTGIKEKKTKKEDVTFKELTKMLEPYVEETKGKKVIIKPKIIIEVAYEEIQKSPKYKSGYALRFPRFMRLRPDKAPKDADTKARIKKLYKQQKGKK
ncbi:ATP-dependent DNA ligase [Candidatus Woesearchaeota archaeon]|nr:ATP-dependent DNA ligase [Candidatus Woesearchaeota archaeon]